MRPSHPPPSPRKPLRPSLQYSGVPAWLCDAGAPRAHPAFNLEEQGVWHALTLSLRQQLIGRVRFCADLRCVRTTPSHPTPLTPPSPNTRARTFKEPRGRGSRKASAVPGNWVVALLLDPELLLPAVLCVLAMCAVQWVCPGRVCVCHSWLGGHALQCVAAPARPHLAALRCRAMRCSHAAPAM